MDPDGRRSGAPRPACSPRGTPANGARARGGRPRPNGKFFPFSGKTFPGTLRTFAVLPLLAALGSGAPASPATAGCDAPIQWRIAELDERFGLEAEEAARAVRRAGLLWQEASGHRFLFQESESGMPIRFVFDERQEDLLERQRMEGELEALEAEAEAARERLEEAEESLEERRMRYESRSAAFRDRLVRHNREVDAWNEEGGAPEDELRRLDARGEELDEERAALNAEVAELNRLITEVSELDAVADEHVSEHDALRSTLEKHFADTEGEEPVVSGRYRESRRALGSWVFSVFREIEIYRFENMDQLVLVLAHELGHALGLEHSDTPGAVMAAEIDDRPESGPPRLHRSDVAQVREVCAPLAAGAAAVTPGG